MTMAALNLARRPAVGHPGAVPCAEDRLSPRDFARLAAHIYKACGITMPEARRGMLEGRLRRRMRLLELDSFADYCNWLFDEANLAEETPALVNAVTTNKTDFFREPAHFAVLRDVVLPDLAARSRRALRVWTAACSTGPEAYTLAMVLDAFANERQGQDYAILATDIDTDVLEIARRGVYPSALVDPVPTVLRQRYVMPALDRRRQECRIVPELRSAIGFAQMNLMQATYPVGEPMDVIFCRNVLIYFDKPTQTRIVAQLVDYLRPGGYLFLAHSEAAVGVHPQLTPIACAAFKKR